MPKISKILLKIILLLPIYCYQYLISPFLPKSCRYYLTCSDYAKKAVALHRIYGIYLTIKRLLSCHPWSKRPVDDDVPRVDLLRK